MPVGSRRRWRSRCRARRDRRVAQMARQPIRATVDPADDVAGHVGVDRTLPARTARDRPTGADSPRCNEPRHARRRRSIDLPSAASSSSCTTSRCSIRRSIAPSSSSCGGSRSSSTMPGRASRSTGCPQPKSANSSRRSALTSSAGVIAGGERRVRPERSPPAFIRRLRARRAGARGRRRHAADRDRPGGGADPADSCAPSAVVLACGVDAAGCSPPLGVRRPDRRGEGLQPDIRPDPSGPRRALYLEGPRSRSARSTSGVRVSGTLELGARGLALARAAWRRSREPRGGRCRAGACRRTRTIGLGCARCRPMDCRCRGRAGAAGLHVATAHATLGITLAPRPASCSRSCCPRNARTRCSTPSIPSRAAPTDKHDDRRTHMKGVHAAIVTQFDDELNVDHDAVAAQVDRLIDEGIHGSSRTEPSARAAASAARSVAR